MTTPRTASRPFNPGQSASQHAHPEVSISLLFIVLCDLFVMPSLCCCWALVDPRSQIRVEDRVTLSGQQTCILRLHVLQVRMISQGPTKPSQSRTSAAGIDANGRTRTS